MPPSTAPRVAIVLSVCNGARYLTEQLDSIRRQTFSQWLLLVRDDGSTDGSRQLLAEAVRQDPERISLAADPAGNLGVVASYSRLLQQVAADYILCCDQDDVWLPDKIALTLSAMQAAEQRFGAMTPLLVHTDLRVVDHHLRPLAPSFWRYRRLAPRSGVELPQLLVHNVVTGCTMMLNRPLAALALPMPPTAMMHDWWLALVAALFGQVVAVDQPTLLYRQHRENSVGASPWGWRRMLQLARQPQAVQAGLVRGMLQAQALLDRYRQRLRPEQAALLEAYAALPAQSPRSRLQTLLTHRYRKHGLARTAGFLYNVLRLPAGAAPSAHDH